MSKHNINRRLKSRDTQEVLVIPALGIITVFCFGFVLMQPQDPIQVRPTAAASQSSVLTSEPKKALPQNTTSEAAALPLQVQAATPAPAITPTTPAANTTPQATTPATSSMLQSANQTKSNSSTSTTSNQKVITNQVTNLTNNIIKVVLPTTKR